VLPRSEVPHLRPRAKRDFWATSCTQGFAFRECFFAHHGDGLLVFLLSRLGKTSQLAAKFRPVWSFRLLRGPSRSLPPAIFSVRAASVLLGVVLGSPDPLQLLAFDFGAPCIFFGSCPYPSFCLPVEPCESFTTTLVFCLPELFFSTAKNNRRPISACSTVPRFGHRKHFGRQAPVSPPTLRAFFFLLFLFLSLFLLFFSSFWYFFVLPLSNLVSVISCILSLSSPWSCTAVSGGSLSPLKPILT